ncbi:MAG: D-alanyl-D-alanine carboxypeptidase [Clostridia bacterium]|nr:D-alanyl-D-alanine carboxypeptidase [Clostridia bacterium]
MKRITAIILAAIILLLSVVVHAELLEESALYPTGEEMIEWVLPTSATALDTTAEGSILIEAETGSVLYEKNPDKALPIASVTKVMTLLLVMEALDDGVIKLEDSVTVSDAAASMGGSQAWMEPGEVLSVHEMLKAVVVSSCNDGAVALAEHLAGSEEEFVRKMNVRASELGMTSTSFVNCTGLDDNAMHKSTARDVAIMSRALISHKRIFEYTTIWTDTIRNGEFGLANTNKLIRFYNGANGLKTGSTSKAKFCLSATAERDGMQLIAVVLGAPSSAERFSDAKRLLDYGFANHAIYRPKPLEITEVSVCGGKNESVPIRCDMTPLLVKKGMEGKIEREINLAEKLTAPVEKGQTVGEIVYKCNGEELARVKAYASEEVKKAEFFDIFLSLVKSLF